MDFGKKIFFFLDPAASPSAAQARMTAPVGVTSSKGSSVSRRENPFSNSSVAGAGSGSSPCSTRARLPRSRSGRVVPSWSPRISPNRCGSQTSTPRSIWCSRSKTPRRPPRPSRTPAPTKWTSACSSPIPRRMTPTSNGGSPACVSTRSPGSARSITPRSAFSSPRAGW